MQHSFSFEHTAEEVTPGQAEVWLESQFGRQRSLREQHVMTLAMEMERGSFVPHSAVVLGLLDGKTYLLDGQHRLKAITLYGKPVTMPVLRQKVTSEQQLRETYANIDQGLKRSAQDAIRAHGIDQELGMNQTDAGRFASALKLIMGGFSAAAGASAKSVKERKAASRSNGVAIDLMKEWSSEGQQYFDAISGGERSTAHLFRRGAVIACGLLSFRHFPEDAQSFWTEAAADDGLGRYDPRKKFLAWLRENQPQPVATVKAFDKAWTAHRVGKEIKLLRIEAQKPPSISDIDIDRYNLATAVQVAG